MGKRLSGINHSKIFIGPLPRITKIKQKIRKWDLIKLKSFCMAKETVNQTKRQPSEWEKIFANKPTDKRLISKIYKQLTQLSIKKDKQPNQKMGRRPQLTLLQRRHTDANKYMKRFSTSLTMREMQTLHWSEWPPSSKQNLQITNAEECVEKKEPSYTTGRNVNWFSHGGEQCGESLKT